jgi:membrane-associated protease RseP (regulator of RpoE activity)
MGAPRHLWSGDWRHESSAHGEELAARRALPGQPDPAEETPPPRSRRSVADRLRAVLRAIRWRPRLRFSADRRRVRIVLLVGLLALVGAGAAYGVTSALSGSGGGDHASANGYQPWLGIDLYNSPYGGPIVVGVAPGSPAQVAGLQPGDVISQVNGKPVTSVSQFASAIAGKHAGDHLTLAFQRGAVTYVTHVRLAARPVAYP